MNFRLAVINGHISDERDHLDLLFDLGRDVIFSSEVEKSDGNLPTRADAKETCPLKLRAFSKFEQLAYDLIAAFKNKRAKLPAAFI